MIIIKINFLHNIVTHLIFINDNGLLLKSLILFKSIYNKY
jgi:hypothetical protein